MHGRSGGLRDESRDPQDELDARADIDPDRPVEPERIKRSAKQRARHGEDFDDGQRQRIADQHIGAEIMEMIGHERGGGRGREGGGDKQRERLLDEMGAEKPGLGRRASLGHEWIGIDVQRRDPRLHDRDQRGDRSERELEADAENGLRLDRDDRENREGEIAHGQRPPVHDHGAEHDQGHEERPLGADARAGRDVVKDRSRHGDRGRPFLDRIVKRQRRRQRQKPPGDDKEDSRDQRHLHAGNRDDVEDAGFSDEVPGVVGEKVALSRHHRRRDRAFVAADDRVDPERQAIARLIDRGVEALAPTGLARRG